MEIAGQDAELPEIRLRSRLFGVLATLLVLTLAGRLFYLQVLEGERFHRLTSDSVVRTQKLPALRGQIRDRKGRVLATVRPSFNLVVSPRQLSREVFDGVTQALRLTPQETATRWERLEKERRRDKQRTLVLAEDVSREAVAAVETGLDVRGVRVVAVPHRQYPNGTLAAHLLGFVNEINAEELAKKKDQGYRAGDMVGRSGIERQWESHLRGRDGFEKVVVDRQGVPKPDIDVSELVEGTARQPAVAGHNVVLTLDLDLQKLADRALRPQRAGAAVVLDVDTGGILAMASHPAFDPNTMSGGLTPEAQTKLLADSLRPLRDKALSETYYPGSTFKVVGVIAGLEDRVLTPQDRVTCRGSFELGNRQFRCTKMHSTVSLHEAVVQSCNVFFYELGSKPGMLDRLARRAAILGLGAPTGIGLNGEEGGFVPSEEWYREEKRRNPGAEGFQLGQALNTVIGQGSTRVTVLQMALLYAAIANGGKLWLPQVVERVETPDGQVAARFPPRMRRDIGVSPESLRLLRAALVGVVNEPRGTAYRSRIDDIEVAGKTGTAQVRRLARRGDARPARPDQDDHAWFVGFAPAGRPRIAMAVLVEHGGHGGEIAAPIAMEIVRGYLNEIEPGDKQAPRVGLARRGEKPRAAPDGEAVTPGEASP